MRQEKMSRCKQSLLTFEEANALKQFGKGEEAMNVLDTDAEKSLPEAVRLRDAMPVWTAIQAGGTGRSVSPGREK